MSELDKKIAKYISGNTERKWWDALKIWNKEFNKKNQFCQVRRGTSEYNVVRRLMNKKKRSKGGKQRALKVKSTKKRIQNLTKKKNSSRIPNAEARIGRDEAPQVNNTSIEEDIMDLTSERNEGTRSLTALGEKKKKQQVPVRRSGRKTKAVKRFGKEFDRKGSGKTRKSGRERKKPKRLGF